MLLHAIFTAWPLSLKHTVVNSIRTQYENNGELSEYMYRAAAAFTQVREETGGNLITIPRYFMADVLSLAIVSLGAD